MTVNDWIAVDVPAEDGGYEDGGEDIGLWLDIDPGVWPWHFISREEANRLIIALGGTPPTK